MQIYNKTQINEIALALKEGKAAILPTDTVWGIVSISDSLIYQIKKRSLDKKVSKFIMSIDELGLPSFYVDILKQYPLGQLSVVWKNISYRVPKSDFIIDLLKVTGPLYQSSANISGKQPIRMSQEAAVEFKNSLHNIVIVDNSPYEQFSGQPSTIIDLDNLTVLREGPVNGQEVIDRIKKVKGAN